MCVSVPVQTFSDICAAIAERLKVYFENAMANCNIRPIAEVAKAGYWLFCNLLKKINEASQSIGKDGKFQIFICVGIRQVLCKSAVMLLMDSG